MPITDAVLVHGSFSSESSWDPGPDVDLHRHAGAVVDHVIEHNLRHVMLVGHSYGGMLVAPVMDRPTFPDLAEPS